MILTYLEEIVTRTERSSWMKYILYHHLKAGLLSCVYTTYIKLILTGKDVYFIFQIFSMFRSYSVSPTFIAEQCSFWEQYMSFVLTIYTKVDRGKG